MRFSFRRPALVAVIALAIGSGLAIGGAVPAFAADENIAPNLDIISAGNAGVVVTPSGLIYVADAPLNLIQIFDASGAYLGDITGTHTGLSGPTGLATDAAGDIYVANQNDNSITVYAPGARLDASPLRDISGGGTALDGVRGVAVDPSGDVYATDFADNEVTVYASGATAAAVPIATIGGATAELDGPYGVAVDATTGVLYVSNLTGDIVSEYAVPLASPASPLRVITGLTSPLAVAVDASGDVYAANYSADSVAEYDPLANGPAAPTSTIVGSSTSLSGPAGLFVDPAGDVFVTSATTTRESEFAADPTIASVSPASGPTSGGTTVAVSGTGFGPTTELTVDGVATTISARVATGFTFVTPAHAVGSVDVVVSTLGGTATVADGFRYLPVLATTGVDPSIPLGVGVAMVVVGGIALFFDAILRRDRRPGADAERARWPAPPNRV